MQTFFFFLSAKNNKLLGKLCERTKMTVNTYMTPNSFVYARAAIHTLA